MTFQPSPDHVAAVRSWTGHLRSGGTTTWSAFNTSRDEASPTDDVPLNEPLPTAPHLELLRRLNEHTAGAGSRLAEVVLATPSPGRGQVDIPVRFPGDDPPFGSRPVDPDRQLPVEELLRLATGVLARLVVPLEDQAHMRTRGHTRVRTTGLTPPWRRRFRLHGAPLSAQALRRSLLDQGLRDTDQRAVHVVLARPLDALLAEHWAARVAGGGIVSWESLWRQASSVNRLPAPVDVTTVAGRLAKRGAEVHVVIEPDPVGLDAVTSSLLGARAGAPTIEPSPAGTDLTRRVGRLLTLAAGRERATALTGRVLPGLIGSSPGTRVGTPTALEEWAVEHAAMLADQLSAADYAVHGDPRDLAPDRSRSLPRSVDTAATLEVALGALVRAAERQG